MFTRGNSMFYCLICNKTHAMVQTDKVFSTGYILDEDKRVPLGICSTGQMEVIQVPSAPPRI